MNKTYRTLWRWHFYAALFVMPFLVVLAVTGTIYCFQPQIESMLYRDRLFVEPANAPRLTEDALLARARLAMPAAARVTTATIDTDPRHSAEFVFRLPDGEKDSIYLNPYTGAVLGTLSVEHRFMQIDRMVHRKLLLGKTGELLMELAACWTLVMVGTGIALWWPREDFSAHRAFWPQFGVRGRPFWKSLHAAMGVWLAVGAIAFILTGLPWSGSWGKQFKSLATRVHLGSPPGAWGGSSLNSKIPGQLGGTSSTPSRETAAKPAEAADSMPGMVMDDLPLNQTPWAVGATAVPQSASSGPAAIPLSEVLAIARAHGLTSGYDVAFPASPGGVYTVSYFPADPKAERTLHLDQYSGEVLGDIAYRDYGVVSKAVSYGTALHMGRYFGLANQLICTLIALGLAAMALTGCVMWWKRRPRHALGAPARVPAPAAMRGWIASLALLGLVFPLMGVTLLAVWIIDGFIFRQRPGDATTPA